MANYKRKRPKQHAISTCGVQACRYDMGRMQINGRDRYPMMYWKKIGEGQRPWRYLHKNV